MRRRSPARWLAPLALLACAFAIYTVVDQELLSDDGGKATTSSSTKTGTGGATGTATTKKQAKQSKTYTVKSGDSLVAIAAKEGVEVDALQEANPDVDASALHPGQKLKIPR
jgi:LysM repeat protein